MFQIILFCNQLNQIFYLDYNPIISLYHALVLYKLNLLQNKTKQNNFFLQVLSFTEVWITDPELL